MQSVKLLFVSTFILFASSVYAGPREDASIADAGPIKDGSIAVRGPREDRSIPVRGPREDWQAVVDALARTGRVAAAADLEAAVSAMTDEELYLGYGHMDLVGLARAFDDTAAAFDAVRAMNSWAFPSRLESDGLPPAMGYPTAPSPCPFSPDRSNADNLLIAVDAIAAANIALEVAEGIWSVSDRACGTVAVAIGAVGNPQNAVCIAADIILFTAKALVNAAQATVDHIAFCDGAVDSAEIEGAYERAGHIHEDLEKVQETLEKLRKLHLAVIQVEEKKHYLLGVTEAGSPVSGAQLVSLHAGAPKKGQPFQDITGSTTTTELTPGVLEVRLSSLPSAVDSDTIFQFHVEIVDDNPFPRFGTALVPGDSNSTYLGPGQ